MIATEAGWRNAEQALRAHHGAELLEVTRKDALGVPFVFWIVLAPKRGALALVRDGKVVSERGLAVVGRLLREEDFLTKKHLDAAALVTLVAGLAALPEEIGGVEGVLTGHPLAAVNPRIEWPRGGGAMLVVHGLRPGGGRKRGSERVPVLRLYRAELTISKAYHLAWRISTVQQPWPGKHRAVAKGPL